MKKILGLVLYSIIILPLANSMADPGYVYGGIAVDQTIIDNAYKGSSSNLPTAKLYQVGEDPKTHLSIVPGSVCNQDNQLKSTGNVYFYKGGSSNDGYQCPLNVYQIDIPFAAYNQKISIVDPAIKSGQPVADDNNYFGAAGCNGTIHYTNHFLNYTPNSGDSCTYTVSFINN